MDFLVEFTENGARVIKDPNLINLKKDNNNVLLNPDISHLAGISPSFWVKDGDKIGHIGLDKSKEVVFNGKLFSSSFDNKVSFPEPISVNIEKLEQLVQKNDIKYEEVVQEIHKKFDNNNEAILLLLDNIKNDFKKLKKTNNRNALIINIIIIISILTLFFF